MVSARQSVFNHNSSVKGSDTITEASLTIIVLNKVCGYYHDGRDEIAGMVLAKTNSRVPRYFTRQRDAVVETWKNSGGYIHVTSFVVETTPLYDGGQ